MSIQQKGVIKMHSLYQNYSALLSVIIRCDFKKTKYKRIGRHVMQFYKPGIATEQLIQDLPERVGEATTEDEFWKRLIEN